MRKQDRKDREHERKGMKRHEREEGYHPRGDFGKREKMDAKQEMGRKVKNLFGRELGMGIPAWDGELEKAEMVPLKNRFSALHDVPMAEAMRMVHGRGTSREIEDRNDTD